MKKTLSILTLAVALFAFGAANAQISVHAGYVQNNLVSTYTNPLTGGETNDTLTRPGFYAGFNYNIVLTGDLGLTLGANLEYYAKNDSTILYNRNFQQLDLVVPVYLNYSFPFGDGYSFTVFAGPTLGLGLMNKSTYTGRITGTVTEYNYYDTEDATNEDYYRERFNWSITGGVRVNFGTFGLHAGYSYGMTDNFSSEYTKGNSQRLFVGANFNL